MWEFFFGSAEEEDAQQQQPPPSANKRSSSSHKPRQQQSSHVDTEERKGRRRSSKKKRGRDPPGSSADGSTAEGSPPATDDDEPSNNAASSSWQQSLLQGQQEREMKAKRQGLYVKKQRCHYYHKGSNQWFSDAHIAGVHFDDGPDKPYYVSENCTIYDTDDSNIVSYPLSLCLVVISFSFIRICVILYSFFLIHCCRQSYTTGPTKMEARNELKSRPRRIVWSMPNGILKSHWSC